MNRTKAEIRSNRKIAKDTWEMVLETAAEEADAMKAIYAVKVEEEALPHVSVSRKKRDVLYQISPSLLGIKGELEESLAIAEEVDDNPGDGINGEHEENSFRDKDKYDIIIFGGSHHVLHDEIFSVFKPS